MSSAAAAADPMASIESVLPKESLVLRGKCVCTTPSPHSIYYELHGTDDPNATRVVFIMGLNNSSFAWLAQVAHFGQERGSSVLVFDNCGIGHSDAPKRRYKTSEMARDTLDLLDHVGWIQERSVNAVGVSMGGMILQELALLAPQRLRSITLTSTKAGGQLLDLPSPKALHMFARILTRTFTDVHHVMSLLVDSLFPSEWLDVPDPDHPGKTRRQAMEEEFYGRFLKSVPPTPAGRLGQLSAALGHAVTAERLKKISETIPKVAIITGDKDELIDPKNSEKLHHLIPNSEYKLVKGGGHALPRQISAEYNAFLKHVFEEAAQKVQSMQ